MRLRGAKLRKKAHPALRRWVKECERRTRQWLSGLQLAPCGTCLHLTGTCEKLDGHMRKTKKSGRTPACIRTVCSTFATNIPNVMQSFLAYLLISGFVALLDVVPLLARRRPGRYCLSVFLQYLFTGMVIFYVTLPVLPLWAQGPVMALCLCLPSVLQPAARGAYTWYFSLLNALVVGLVVSFLKLHLPSIAHFFSAAA